MSEEVDDGIKSDPAKNNPWYDFLLKSIELDKGDEGKGHYGKKPHGWHWFWGIYFLHQKMFQFPSFSLTEIQKSLPDEHWLKNATDDGEKIKYQFGGDIPDSVCQADAVSTLHKILQKLYHLETVKEIDFSKFNFPEHVNFSNLIFPVGVSFFSASFPADSRFINTIFCNKVAFGRVVFTDSVFFDGAQFFNEANFVGAQFCHELFSHPCFNKAVFSGRALFTLAKFEGKIFFKETIFSEDAIFEKTEFTWQANFEKAKFFEKAIFTNATFPEEIKFDRATFGGHTNFINTKFKKYVPSFHKADIHSSISWDINVNLWPQLKKYTKDEADKEYNERIEANQNAYENLASQMKELDKYHDEHFFFRQEMRCRRVFENFFIRIPYVIYDSVSDYGYSIGKAFSWWFLHILLGASLLFIHRFFSPIGKWHDDLSCSFGISLANAHGFLSFHDKALKSCRDHLDKLYWFNTIWLFQTIIGIILLFLVVLTLRIRFRLK